MNAAHAGIAGLLVLAAYLVTTGPGRDPMTVGSISSASSQEPVERFALLSSWEDGACLVTVTGPAGEGIRPLRLDPACAGLGEGFGSAVYWLERQDGSVAFLDPEGAVKVEFSLGDGSSFESYSPAEPVMTLLPAG